MDDREDFDDEGFDDEGFDDEDDCESYGLHWDDYHGYCRDDV